MARSRPRSRLAFRLFLAVLAAIALCAAWEAVTWPDVARLAREQPKTTAFIDEYRARQRILGKPARVAWTWTPYAAISPDIKRAVLVAEDINFFAHRGFELAELQNALEEALRDRGLPRGASTITQQLAKNLWLSPSRNPLAQAQGSHPHLAARARAAQAPHPRPPERGGVRPRRLRRGRGEPALLRQARRPSGPAEAAQLAAACPIPRLASRAESPAYRRRVATILNRMARRPSSPACSEALER